MSNQTARVPRTISKFNPYINSTTDFLLTIIDPIANPGYRHADRLGLTAIEMTDWDAKKVYWKDTLYPKWSNANTKTKAVNLEVKNKIKSFATFAEKILTRMSVNPAATEADEIMFRFKINRDPRTVPTEPISEQCYATVVALGGGDMKIGCKTSHDASRPSKAAGADSVEHAYTIIDTAASGGGIPLPGEPTKPAAKIPANAEDGTTLLQAIKKASHTVHFGVANSGKMLYLFSRWYNSSHPELAGPWSEVVTVRIM